MPRPKKTIDDNEPTLDISLDVIKALYQYNPNTAWLANYLGMPEAEVQAVYGEYLKLLDPDRTKNVEFTLYYLATVRKDIRAVLAWLEVYDSAKYGKASTDVDLHSLKLDILTHLAKQLPG